MNLRLISAIIAISTVAFATGLLTGMYLHRPTTSPSDGHHNCRHEAPTSSGKPIISIQSLLQKQSAGEVVDSESVKRVVSQLDASQIREALDACLKQDDGYEVITELVIYDSTSALKWFNIIQDAAVKESVSQSLAQGWFGIDPDAAKAWVAQSNLSEEFKKEFAERKP